MVNRVECALENALSFESASGMPPKLLSAMRYSVFPGGARIRAKLCLAVANAAGDDLPEITDAAAVAIELLHCASLVHDDLPCFDDAQVRRGKPSVHRMFGEPVALLTGDALIVLAFEHLGRKVAASPERVSQLFGIVGRSVGMPNGIVAGQAWECEERVDVAEYHRMKTGALFAGATAAGAAAAGADPGLWNAFGAKLGEAYQVADDLRDAVSDALELGKPVGRDAELGRPSAVAELGVDGAVRRVAELVDEASAAIPECSGSEILRKLLLAEAQRVVPAQAGRQAA